MSQLKLAAAQIECRGGDVAANLALHQDSIRQARALGADVVVFPELSLTDYLSAPDVAVLALDRVAPQLRDLAESCAGLMAVVGFIEKADGRFYNSAATLRDGEICHVHRKINLATYGRLQEGLHYSPGSELNLDQALQSRIGTLICADTWNPALPWLAALKGADLMFVPVASSHDAVHPDFDNPAGWDINLRHTALTYGMPIVMCNHCGDRGALRFWGGSRILDAYGRALALAGPRPELIVAQIDSEDTRIARSRLPTMRNASADLVASVLQQTGSVQ